MYIYICIYIVSARTPGRSAEPGGNHSSSTRRTLLTHNSNYHNYYYYYYYCYSQDVDTRGA